MRLLHAWEYDPYTPGSLGIEQRRLWVGQDCCSEVSQGLLQITCSMSVRTTMMVTITVSLLLGVLRFV